VILAVVLLRALDLDTEVLGLLQRIESSGTVGLLVFAVVVCLFVILMLPTVLLTLGAGALYGVALGSTVLVLAVTIGAAIAFLLGRKLFIQPISTQLLRRSRLGNALHLLRADDWQLVALLRMIPFFPSKLSNYLLSFTPVTISTFIKGTLVGLWPITLFNVYLGSMANDLLLLQQTDTFSTPNYWVLSAAGLLFTGVIVVLATRRAMDAFAELKSTQTE